MAQSMPLRTGISTELSDPSTISTVVEVATTPGPAIDSP